MESRYGSEDNSEPDQPDVVRPYVLAAEAAARRDAPDPPVERRPRHAAPAGVRRDPSRAQRVWASDPAVETPTPERALPERAPRSRRLGWLLTAGLVPLAVVAAGLTVLAGEDAPAQQGPAPAQPPVAAGTDPPQPSAAPKASTSRPSRLSPRATPPAPTTPVPTPPQPSAAVPPPKPTATGSRIVMTPTSYEAESVDNRLRAGARIDGHPAASGDLMVYAIGAPNLGTLEFHRIAAPATGTYTLTIFYQNPDSTVRTAHVAVNGGLGVPMRFDPTGTCCIGTLTTRIGLVAGTGNTILFGNPDTRAPDIDRVELAP